jgi:4-amino-4-deoxy-L-arabinose transferase-like glycosyltransferase
MLVTTWVVLSFMGSRIHTYYTYSLGAPAAIVCALGFYAALRAPTPWVRRALPAILVMASTYFAVRIMGYADAWGPWPLLVTALGVAVALLCVTPVPNFQGKELWKKSLLLICFAFMAVSPLGTDVVTSTSPQGKVFPISGPTPRDPNAIAHVVDEMRTNNPRSLIVQQNGAPPSRDVEPDNRLSRGSWLVATYPAQNAALYQLETKQPAMAIGGWSGLDPSVTLTRFQQLVADHRIDYFVGYAQLAPYFRETEVGRIERWIDEHFRKSTTDGIIVYDLRLPRS